MKQTAVEWLFNQIKKDMIGIEYDYADELKQAKEMERLQIEGSKWQQEQILEFLYLEITERRDYSASKMCEVVIEFIEQLNNKK